MRYLQDERFNERIPVECQLNLSGKLFNPIVGFNIYLPTADEETRTYLQKCNYNRRGIKPAVPLPAGNEQFLF